MTETENPPALTTSPRAAWPKTKPEIAAARDLIKQCYQTAHTDRHVIQWEKIKTEHSELYDRLMFFAADNFQHIYELANRMRKTSGLPSPYVMDLPKKHKAKIASSNGHSSLDGIDSFLREHGKDFPRTGKGVAWDVVKRITRKSGPLLKLAGAKNILTCGPTSRIVYVC